MGKQLKILVVGPKESGKTNISNYICEFTDRLGNDDIYKPTIGTRILECERSFALSNASIELWDCSGDQTYEGCWPAIMKDADGVLIVYNPANPTHQNEAMLWFEWFIQNNSLDPCQCIVFAHDTPNEKYGKSNPQADLVRFPKTIQQFRTNYDSPKIVREEFDHFVQVVYEYVQKSRK